MPLFYLHKDITKISADAIVNPANPTLLGGGGVDGAIHNAAGPKLLEECKTLGGCKTGQAKYTAGYELSCKYIIHTVGPVWHGGTNGERELLRECYRNCLLLAKELGCETVAFPVISAGAYGYPPTQAKEVAESEILSFLSENDMTVYLVMRDKIAAERTRLFSAIEYFMMQNGISGTDDIPAQVLENKSAGGDLASLFGRAVQRATSAMKPSSSRKKDKGVTASFGECTEEKVMSLEDMLANLDESFSQTLLRLIDSSGMTDSECYKRANIDRKLFSKIRSDKNYRPSKSTVIAFAFALSLDIEDTRMLLERAGFALSRASRFDVIVEYAIKNGIYDVFEVNKVLFEYDQNLLGGVQL